MKSLNPGARTVIKQCMNIQKNESVLIITDKEMPKKIPKVLFEEVKKVTKNVVLKYIRVLERSGDEPPEEIAELMKSPDVLLIPTTKSLSHTKARREACKNGVRVASMPSVPVSSFVNGGLRADYNEVKQKSLDMFNAIREKSKIHITSPNGTDLEMKVGDYIWDVDEGLYHKPGDFGNLPAGEVCTAPNKCSSNGLLVVDKMGHFGENIEITVKNGYAIKINGSPLLKKTIIGLGKDGRNIAELGIGTNPNAKVIGVTLEDEKVYGTVHVALGNNVSWGGDCDVNFHDDGIILNPTLKVDGEVLIKDGKWTIQ